MDTSTVLLVRIRYDRLFGTLIKRGLSPMIMRIIMDLYERQESRAMWDNEYVYQWCPSRWSCITMNVYRVHG